MLVLQDTLLESPGDSVERTCRFLLMAKSYSEIQDDAQAARDDGANPSCSTLRCMAKGGNVGQNRNAARDIHRGLMRDLDVNLTIYPIDIPRVDVATGLCKDRVGGILAPQEAFSALYHFDADHRRFYRLLGEPADWVTFWKAHSSEVWFQDHPLHHALTTEPHKCVPYFVLNYNFHPDPDPDTKSTLTINSSLEN